MFGPLLHQRGYYYHEIKQKVNSIPWFISLFCFLSDRVWSIDSCPDRRVYVVVF